nr:ATP-binding cassette domain-containing protein [Prolixibacter bellariivorans]
MIEIKGLCKSFEGRPILKDISTKFEKGKTNLIIGQSGSGKTVLLKSIVGLLDIDEGEILYNGEDVSHLSDKKRKSYGRISGWFSREVPCLIHLQ